MPAPPPRSPRTACAFGRLTGISLRSFVGHEGRRKMTRTRGVGASRPAARKLLCCGAVAGPFFATVFLFEGMRRADYKPLRHPVSSLSLGPRGWVQVTNFAAAGMLYLAGAAGLSGSPGSTECRRLGSAVLGATGLGLLGSAKFKPVPVSGYPPGTPDGPLE